MCCFNNGRDYAPTTAFNHVFVFYMNFPGMIASVFESCGDAFVPTFDTQASAKQLQYPHRQIDSKLLQYTNHLSCFRCLLTMAAAFGSQKWNARAVLAHHVVFVANIRTCNIVP